MKHPSVSLRQLFQLHPSREQTTSRGFLRSNTFERSDKGPRAAVSLGVQLVHLGPRQRRGLLDGLLSREGVAAQPA
jgi:hypothetical protein